MCISSPKILIADDDKGILHMMVMALELNGYVVWPTLDGSLIHEKVFSKPDMIILDVWLGDLDGRDLCKKIKSNPLTQKIPVLMMSANCEVKESSIACGANEFLEKPFEIQTLISFIKKWTA